MEEQPRLLGAAAVEGEDPALDREMVFREVDHRPEIPGPDQRRAAAFEGLVGRGRLQQPRLAARQAAGVDLAVAVDGDRDVAQPGRATAVDARHRAADQDADRGIAIAGEHFRGEAAVEVEPQVSALGDLGLSQAGAEQDGGARREDENASHLHFSLGA